MAKDKGPFETLTVSQALPDLYIDVQNAASMLFRLERQGINVGDRWIEPQPNSTWLCYKNSAFLALVNLRSTHCPHVLSAGRTRPELSDVGPKYKAKPLTNLRQSAGN
jgi:hypothetical protein